MGPIWQRIVNDIREHTCPVHGKSIIMNTFVDPPEFQCCCIELRKMLGATMKKVSWEFNEEQKKLDEEYWSKTKNKNK